MLKYLRMKDWKRIHSMHWETVLLLFEPHRQFTFVQIASLKRKYSFSVRFRHLRFIPTDQLMLTQLKSNSTRGSIMSLQN